MGRMRFEVLVDVEQVGDGMSTDELKAALSLEIQAALGSKLPILDINENPVALVRNVNVVWHPE